MTWYGVAFLVVFALGFVWVGLNLYFLSKFDHKVMLIKALQDAGQDEAARKVAERL